MNKGTKILSVLLFTGFFAAGWISGISPVKATLEKVKSGFTEVKQKLTKIPPVNISKNYISPNQYNIDILLYNINLDLHPEKKLIKSTAVITGVFLNNLDSIDLNFYDNLTIDSLKVNGRAMEYTRSATRLAILFEGSKADTFTVEISYSGTPKRGGLSAFTFGEINGKSVVYNMNEPTYASTWFPCNDMPSDKALLDISITNDSSRTSISNGKLIGEKISGDRKTFRWKTYYPISTYLVAIYSSGYQNFSDVYISQDKQDTMKIEYYAFPEHVEKAKTDFEDHVKFMNFFARIFGEYPFIKEKYGVAEFLWQLGAMEHQTITGIGSNFIGGLKMFNDIYVHELAHHWWGDAVGPATWKDIWLNEGFATYSEALYDEHLAGAPALKSTMRSKFKDDFGRLYDPGDNLFGSTIYDKGGWVLHTLRWEVGDSSFFKILKKYFEDYKYKTASTEDFRKVCEAVSGKDLNKFFDQWVYTGSGIIKADYSWKIEKLKDSYIIHYTLSQTQKGYDDYHFPLQIELQYADKKQYRTINIDARRKTYDIEVTRLPDDIIPDPNDWLLASFTDKNSYEN